MLLKIKFKMVHYMKSKCVKKYLNKNIKFTDIWGNTITGKMIEVERYFATILLSNNKTLEIKTFNIQTIECIE